MDAGSKPSLLSSPIVRLGALFGLILIVPLRNFRTLISVSDPDIWTHLRLGEWITQHHALPHTGVFSSFGAERPWVAYSWVFELVVTRSFHALGLLGLPVILAVLETLVVVGLFLLYRRVSRDYWTALVVTVAVLLAMYPVLSLRPAMFSYLCLIGEMALIMEARRTGSVRPLYWIPLVLFLWSNLHVQFIYGLALFGLFFSCEFLNTFLKRHFPVAADPLAAQWPRIGGLFVASAIATCIGPYWGKVYGTIFGYVSNTSQFNQIDELSAPTFRMGAHYFEIVLLVAAFYFAGWKKSFDLFRVCALLFGGALALHAVRDAWVVGIISGAFIAECFRKEESSEPFAWSATWKFAAVAVAGFLVSFAIGSPHLRRQTLTTAIDLQYPLRAANFVREQHLTGPMYNSLNWGGFLMFTMPEYPVTIDGRTDVYGPEYISRAILTLNGRAWEQDPELAKANFVLIEKELPLSYILAEDPRWRLAYSDHIAAVFVRNQGSGTPGPAK